MPDINFLHHLLPHLIINIPISFYGSFFLLIIRRETWQLREFFPEKERGEREEEKRRWDSYQTGELCAVTCRERRRRRKIKMHKQVSHIPHFFAFLLPIFLHCRLFVLSDIREKNYGKRETRNCWKRRKWRERRQKEVMKLRNIQRQRSYPGLLDFSQQLEDSLEKREREREFNVKSRTSSHPRELFLSNTERLWETFSFKLKVQKDR